MYETTFKLADRPFLATPQTNRYFAAEPIENARQTLIRGIERAEGPGLLIGPPGSGKSLICQLLAEQFADEFEVVMLSSTRLCTPRALLQNILFELGLPFRDLEEGELRLNLIDFLQRNDKCPNGILLLVDEANTLPLRLLEEIRMITNVVRDGIPRVRLVLAGGPQLEERFTSPRLESLNQRIAARCYLQSMTREETANYVKHQVSSAGGNPDVLFTDDALRAVYHATDGIPRLVNQVCDHALMLAAAAADRRITASGIEESWADLQQLPSPSLSLEGASADVSVQSDIIEFGQLDDELSGFVDQQSESENADFDSDESVTIAEDTPTGAASDNSRREVSLSEIEMPVVDTLQAQWAGDDEHTQSCQNSDPFEMDFDEEEVVLDRYAALDSSSGDRPISDPTTEFAKQISEESTAGDDPQDSTISESVTEAAAIVQWEPTVAAPVSDEEIACDSKKDPQTHDVQEGPEPSDDEPTIHCIESAVQVGEPSVEHAEVPDDDRDMIVIEEDSQASESVPEPATTRVRRREYRHLFAKLRRS